MCKSCSLCHADIGIGDPYSDETLATQINGELFMMIYYRCFPCYTGKNKNGRTENDVIEDFMRQIDGIGTLG